MDLVELTDAELDESGPERTCIVTRAKGSPDQMIRFVAAPDGTVTPDLKRRLPGRGVWVTATAKAVAAAVKKGAFARGLRAKVTASAALAEEVDALLARDALQYLSLVNKAGLVVTGFAKVEKLIAGEAPIAGMIHAVDAGDDGVRKMGQLLSRRYGEAAAVPRAILFASGQMDLALGRANVIHAALKTGPAAQAFFARARRLSLYRGASESGLAMNGDDKQDVGSELDPAVNDVANGLGPGIRNELVKRRIPATRP
jgi:predicted RNA-binding protein YlxR (DUF448 family)